jgi:hypothetical protein
VPHETDWRLYLVEHDLRGLSPAQLASVHRALGEAVHREIRRGSQIRYVQRIDAPDEHRCLCLFEAIGPEAVRRVNDIAQFPLARVVAVRSSAPATTPNADLEDDERRLPARTSRRSRGGSMSKLPRVAEIPAGSWTKRLVVGFWVVVVTAAYPRHCGPDPERE